jgi:hydroxymethylpyrimidine/phosphomethylpyrimidine kinase
VTEQPPIILTLAGSDPSAGAGIQADLKTIHACGGYATTVITALTVQNTLGVQAVETISADLVRKQAQALLSDMPPSAIKISMLGNKANVEAVIELIHSIDIPVVLDTVLVSSSGHPLLEDDAIEQFKSELIPLCDVVTPNLPEARLLLNLPNANRQTLTQALQDWEFWQSPEKKPSFVLKGGHEKGDMAVDTLITPNQVIPFQSPMIETQNLHGTGCTFSSALATFLAQGDSVILATEKAKRYTHQAILKAKNLHFGKGSGGLAHF